MLLLQDQGMISLPIKRHGTKRPESTLVCRKFIYIMWVNYGLNTLKKGTLVHGNNPKIPQSYLEY